MRQRQLQHPLYLLHESGTTNVLFADGERATELKEHPQLRQALLLSRTSYPSSEDPIASLQSEFMTALISGTLEQDVKTNRSLIDD